MLLCFSSFPLRASLCTKKPERRAEVTRPGVPERAESARDGTKKPPRALWVRKEPSAADELRNLPTPQSEPVRKRPSACRDVIECSRLQVNLKPFANKYETMKPLCVLI
ncbi:Hypothetical predicted protein [Podarcis lilfordi]|uniref:Uncharacterized protein n=1 Tax=Podarcis lilfordi TaxID=74358 RepID=A0AA35LNE8_9SAUR|nr:Hypothetical predicted protein [Podarcis lilfordi]